MNIPYELELTETLENKFKISESRAINPRSSACI
jgi:hypothetical protein